MTSRKQLLAYGVLAIGLVTLVLAPWTRSGGAELRPAGRVVVVAVPRLTWELLAEEEATTPNLQDFVRSAAVAHLSVRTVGARTTISEGYATIGAGNRATTYPLLDGAAFDRDATTPDGGADEVWRTRTGQSNPGAVVHVGIASQLDANDELLYGAELGTLGAAVGSAGRSVAIVANADTVSGVAYRPAALAVMDAHGSVAAGTVSQELLLADPAAPYGVRSDIDAFAAAIRSLVPDNAVTLVEASDLDRADQFRELALPEASRAHELAALRSTDAILGTVISTVDLQRDAVILVSPVAPREGEALTVFAMRGPGVRPGFATSATTRRPGYVGLSDIGPTVLDWLQIDVPDEMSGTPAFPDRRATIDGRSLHDLADTNERAIFRDAATGPVSVTFVVTQVIVYALTALALTGRRGRWQPVVAFLALTVLAIPPVGFWSGLVAYDSLSVAGYTFALVGASAVLAGAAVVVGRLTGRELAPALVLVGLIWLTMAVDIVTGGTLQINTVFGYSPIVAGRFAGFGNLAFGLIATSALILATTGSSLFGRSRAVGDAEGQPVVNARLVFAGILLAATVVLDGHPAFGSDAGGVVAIVPAFAIALLVLTGRRLNLRRTMWIVGGTVAVVSCAALLDLSRPAQRRTHLGRFVDRIVGDGNALEVVQRKAQTNLNILTSSVWTLIIPCALGLLVFLTWRQRGFAIELERRAPGIWACLWGAIAVGFLGFAVNDSGVAVPAIMFGVLLPFLSYIVLRTYVPPPPGSDDDEPGSVQAAEPSGAQPGVISEGPGAVVVP